MWKSISVYTPTISLFFFSLLFHKRLRFVYIDRTWWAFEFEGAVWNSLGEWKYFIWKANDDDVTRGFLINIHGVGKSPQQILLSGWSDSYDVITLWDKHWWCHHFMLSGPEVFTTIFLQFSPKTSLAKYNHQRNGTVKIWVHFIIIQNDWNPTGSIITCVNQIRYYNRNEHLAVQLLTQSI